MNVPKTLFALSLLFLFIAGGLWVKEEIRYRNAWITYAHELQNNTKVYETKLDFLYTPTDTQIPELNNYYYNITKDTAAGRYNPNTDLITLYTGRTNTTILHEIGHRIWWTKLNITQRNEWTLIHDKDNQTVSEYAHKDEGEDFAETIEYWYSAQIINSTIRYTFIQNNKQTWE